MLESAVSAVQWRHFFEGRQGAAGWEFDPILPLAGRYRAEYVLV